MRPSNPTNRRSAKPAPIDTAYGHLPPQATEIEQVVLGALLIDTEAFGLVSETLHPETFYDPRHEKIFEAIRSLNMSERPADILTVSQELRKMGELEKAGGMPYLVELSSMVSSSANVEYHSRILAQKSMARQLITYASNIETKAFDETVDTDELIQEAEGALFELSQKNMKQDYTQIDPVVKKAYEILQKAAAQSGGLTGIPSGLDDLDAVTSGWQPSDLVIIAGRPAMGKTSYALSVAKNIAVDYRIPIAFFSLEMSNVQLVNRLISNVCEIPGNKILNGQLTDEEWARLDNNIRKMDGAPLYIDDTPGLSVFELRTKARRLVKEKGVKIIMIDYLQLMNANGMRFNSRQEEVSTISRSLKGLAKELDIPILALSQLNRSVESRGDGETKGIDSKRPQLSDLRESGAIEQDADMVQFVHRPEYYHIYEDNGQDLRGMAQIIIAKHRKGATKDVLLSFRGEFTRFANKNERSAGPVAGDDGGGEIRQSSLSDYTDDPFGSIEPPAPGLDDMPY
ncbi:MAG: replicative DNA helicase [Bacteroidales bacterium]|nr:replicative DNA helicase [Bacteroidales bacterium]MDD6494395.1 replicative DNA helicase [Bacteroidales bacterium]